MSTGIRKQKITFEIVYNEDELGMDIADEISHLLFNTEGALSWDYETVMKRGLTDAEIRQHEDYMGEW